MCAALYSALLEESSRKPDVPKSSTSANAASANVDSPVDSCDSDNRSATAIVLAEALCSVDEDNKHTAQINDLLCHVTESIESKKRDSDVPEVDDVMAVVETWSDELAFTDIGRNSLKVSLPFFIRWKLTKLPYNPKKKLIDNVFLEKKHYFNLS